MGGKNESVLEPNLQSNSKASSQATLQPDENPPQATQDPVHSESTPPVHPSPTAAMSSSQDVPLQKQKVRQHLSGQHCHFHDDDQQLKASIPVADWYTAMRSLRNMQKWTYLDTSFNTLIEFTPFVSDGVVEVVVELQRIEVGQRLRTLETLTN